MRNPHLDKSALDHNLASAGVGALAEEVRRSNRLAFSLTRDEGDSERTAQHLGAVLDVLAALETVETGLNDALRRYQSTLSQEDYDAQQLLRGRKEVLDARSEEHTSELQSLMRISYAVFCLKKKKHK